jgi:hypothetical protein
MQLAIDQDPEYALSAVCGIDSRELDRGWRIAAARLTAE